MKITIDIDCTPDEARQFMGLPDLKPMQAHVLAKMETQMIEALDRFSPDGLLRSWMSLVPPGAADIPGMFEQFIRQASKPSKP